ncbi:hypothetical protein V6N11_010066 [Hibiscus sabdariffa]|uniref:Uncharacterized protein n=1 Tax=Hibiscus sabdariffa TaxID=183260 RepID=A0ABR2PDJ1_9ROSI
MTPARDKGESEVGEAGTCYASSDVESYEEQMMLAMVTSLSEAKAMTSGSGVPWQLFYVQAIRNHVSRADVAGSGGYRPIFELQQVGPMQLA